LDKPHIIVLRQVLKSYCIWSRGWKRGWTWSRSWPII